MEDRGNFFINLPDFPAGEFYNPRRDAIGWWMVTKEILINIYIDIYLRVWRGQVSPPHLVFIDPLASNGMNRVTKEGGKHVFTFPGTSMLAAWWSTTPRGFDEILANDLNGHSRAILVARLNCALQSEGIQRPTRWNVEPEIAGKLDSNVWILEVLRQLKQAHNRFAFLAVIDNQGADIDFSTLQQMVDACDHGDFIITLQNHMFCMNRDNDAMWNRFMGKDLTPNATPDGIREDYIAQLRSIGLKGVEWIPIRGSHYFYTLLFCTRKADPAWFRPITKYKESHFEDWIDANVMQLWDIVTHKQKTLF